MHASNSLHTLRAFMSLLSRIPFDARFTATKCTSLPCLETIPDVPTSCDSGTALSIKWGPHGKAMPIEAQCVQNHRRVSSDCSVYAKPTSRTHVLISMKTCVASTEDFPIDCMLLLPCLHPILSSLLLCRLYELVREPFVHSSYSQ
jgi:hypothetical protein